MAKTPKRLNMKRLKIDKIDAKILLLLEKRLCELREIKKIKEDLNLKLRDKKRESYLVKRAKAVSKNPRNKQTLVEIYKKILSESLLFLSENE